MNAGMKYSNGNAAIVIAITERTNPLTGKQYEKVTCSIADIYKMRATLTDAEWIDIDLQATAVNQIIEAGYALGLEPVHIYANVVSMLGLSDLEFVEAW